jgi:hypothetical protein
MVSGTTVDPLWPIVIAFCIMPVLILAAICTVSGTWFDAMGAQCILAGGSFVALRLLNHYPMVNPVHAVVLVFHWWFGFGPSVCGLYWTWKGDTTTAQNYLMGAMTPTLIVALGLPLYAWSARAVLHHWKRPQLTAVVPAGPVYGMGTLLRIAAVPVLASLTLRVLAIFNLQVFNTVNYMGGQSTETWWLVPFAEADQLLDFAVVIACSLLAVPHLRKRAVTRLVMFGIILIAMQRGLTSGSKGPLVLPAFYFVVAFVNWRRRVPWVVLVAALCGYLVVVEPFVATMRLRAQTHSAATAADRIEIFREGWADFQISGPGSGRDVNVASLFRGIYSLAKETADQSSFFEGPWKGQSLRDGFSGLLPRALFPNKAASNIGNFFARQLGVLKDKDYSTNVAITIPFEIVGNYGWVAGCLSFAAIGVVWASFVAFVLTVPRMTTHPLAPYLIVLAMVFEASVGHFGNTIKALLIPLALLYLVCQMKRKRASG